MGLGNTPALAAPEACAHPNSKLRILVVDDHVLVREGLADLLNRQLDLLCCGTATNLTEAEKAVLAESPDVMLLDLRLGSENGFGLIKHFVSRFPSLRILVLSQLDDTIYAERVLRAGARGYVMKEQATDELPRAIRAVAAGQISLNRRDNPVPVSE